MKELADKLGRAGYLPFYLYFGDGNLRVGDWAVAAQRLSEPLRSLVQLFLLQSPANRRHVTAALGECLVERMKHFGVIRNGGSTFECQSFSLLSFRSNLYFCQLNDDPFAYFGEDSVALGTYQSPAPGGDVLDLCSGPGIQALIAARNARHVTGVEVNPKAWSIAKLNKELNHVGDHVELVNSSLQDFAKTNTRKFDRILFNPPLVPVPDDMSYAFVGHGGSDGLSVTDDILGLYRPFLKTNGRFEFIGMTVGKKESTLAGDPLVELAKKHHLEGTIHVLSRHRIREQTPLVTSCAISLARSNKIEISLAQKQLIDFYQNSDFDYFYLFFCSWGKAAKGRRAKASVVDMSYYYFGDWFA